MFSGYFVLLTLHRNKWSTVFLEPCAQMGHQLAWHVQWGNKICDIMTRRIKTFSSRVIYSIMGHISFVLSKTITHPPWSLANVNKVGTPPTAKFVYNICGNTCDGTCNLPWFSCWVALVSWYTQHTHCTQTTTVLESLGPLGCFPMLWYLGLY